MEKSKNERQMFVLVELYLNKLICPSKKEKANADIVQPMVLQSVINSL